MSDVLCRINKYMKLNGLKQNDIVHKSGLSTGYVSKVVNGKKNYKL